MKDEINSQAFVETDAHIFIAYLSSAYNTLYDDDSYMLIIDSYDIIFHLIYDL